MDVNFLNQNPCIPSWPGVFQFDIFFIVFLSSSMFISLSGLLRILLALSSYYLSIQLFRYAFFVAIFLSKNVRFLWRPVIGMFLCHALPVVGRSFFLCFECPVLFVLFYPLSISL